MSDKGGGYRFRDWFSCPECDERDDISSLAYETKIVFECYACGLVSAFVVGKDISVQHLDVDAIKQVAEERSDTSS